PRVPRGPRGRARGIPGNDRVHLSRPLLHQPRRDEDHRSRRWPPVTYLGDYDDYLAAKVRTAEASTAREPAAPRAPAMDPTPMARSRPKSGISREVRELRRRLDEVEREIHALEERLTGLGRALGDPALYTDGERARTVARERKEAEEQVAWLMREWEALSTELAAHE